jgi:hypothetical protein
MVVVVWRQWQFVGYRQTLGLERVNIVTRIQVHEARFLGVPVDSRWRTMLDFEGRLVQQSKVVAFWFNMSREVRLSNRCRSSELRVRIENYSNCKKPSPVISVS